ncbi:uncharacterized protein N7484_011860 [Penicillium longicatenatum]|uniref:uncharacterized protein n=1 Tax=Penicillium longicatenatum TaxID=1561947 RepID=UPI0025478D5A|nr:uncharacterized protein N7484_011860 [Penicillium longicatenatum]KAJ5631760.1 hypothetical protein N7484_011860 [Penicillium longicatenatum]
MADTIHIPIAQYFQLVDPPKLDLPPDNVLIRPEVQAALYKHMFDESLTTLPPATYRARVLKLIIARIEGAITDPEEDEILDDLMEAWGNLLAQPKPSALEIAKELSHVKYTAPLQQSSPSDRTVITVESRGLILAGGTTGNRTWEAALHLGSFLASPAGQEIVQGKRVIELGAGTGFLSLLCARHLGVKGVVATDREPFLIDNMRECVQLNSDAVGKALPMYPAIWDWGTPLIDTEEMGEIVEGGQPRFDVALGADLTYDVDIIPLLLSTAKDLFENYNVKQFIIAATLRNETTFQAFLTECNSFGFNAECLPFVSTPADRQTGFFHATDIPIRTYIISPV